MKRKLMACKALIILTSLSLSGCHDAPADVQPLQAMPIFEESDTAPSDGISPAPGFQDTPGSTSSPSPGSQDAPGSTSSPSPDSQGAFGETENDRESDGKESKMPSLKALLQTALLPVGQTAYVWGGGWNEEDTGAGEEARTLGVSPGWKEFADRIPASYDHKQYRYQIHDGLDCSGYVGWVIYNALETENGRDGYVYSSTDAASIYASLGFGEYLPKEQVTDWRPGDVASMSGHVWLCLGTCGDGSVLLVHSSPPGVRICGTLLSGKSSDATLLAEELMREHYPDWYERFPDCSVKESYLTSAGQMRWNEETLPDAKAMQALTAEELSRILFP